jgi:hypothetical protein
MLRKLRGGHAQHAGVIGTSLGKHVISQTPASPANIPQRIGASLNQTQWM